MIPYGRHHIDEDDVTAVVDVLRNKALTQGPLVEEFERAVAEYVGAKYAIAVSSCTAALHMCALASGVGPGKNIVTTPITFVSTSNSALYAGGLPIFSDIDPETINLSPRYLKETIQTVDNISAITPVHFGGLPCDMKAISKIAKDNNALVYEDAAHAIGATYRDGKKVGSCAYSKMTAFSFHPVKQIAAGEGGMVTTNDEEIYRFMLRFRSHGINKMGDKFKNQEAAFTEGTSNIWYYEMQELGMHYRITDIQCALGLSQLKKLDKFIARRRQLAKQYDILLSEFEHLKPAQIIGRNQSGHHLYPLRINFEALKTTRAKFMLALREKDIITQVHYIPVNTNPYYQNLKISNKSYPEADKYYQQALTIPLYYSLTNDEQLYVVDALKSLAS